MVIPSVKYFPDESTVPTYSGNDLGIYYTPEATQFKVWSPLADEIMLSLYENGHDGTSISTFQLTKNTTHNIWELTLNGDYKNKYYTYNVKYRGNFLGETPGIYAKAAGVNGIRGMIVDLTETNPSGWANDIQPVTKNTTDAVIYELHIRDFTIHESAQTKYRGKYKGLAENGNHLNDGTKVGLNHLVELGITHVHLLPVFDFMSIDESKVNSKKYNWGYDPDNYNLPEGSYASDPYHAEVRIKEFKEMVLALHQNGIGVIMDVVFNHTGPINDSNFNKEFPNYYYRFTENKRYSDGSGCRSETASEKTMMRKYIIDSCMYWASEYHIDGFRFDLMGVHDIETMNQLSDTLHNVYPNMLIYGEGWTGGECALPENLRAIKHNTFKLKKIAAFSDDIRDALKGSVFNLYDNGFIGGKAYNSEILKRGIVASVNHHQVKGHQWAPSPTQCVNYVSCHDNFTLFDKISHSSQSENEQNKQYMHKFALAIILTSQGIPFLHAGCEFLRSKNGDHNSYNKPDSINQINWYLKSQHLDVFNYVKNLITLRRNHPAFRMIDTNELNKHLLFWGTYNENVVSYQLKNHANGDRWKNIVVILNSQKKTYKSHLPKGNWYLATDREKVYHDGVKSINGGEFITDPISCTIFFEKE